MLSIQFLWGVLKLYIVNRSRPSILPQGAYFSNHPSSQQCIIAIFEDGFNAKLLCHKTFFILKAPSWGSEPVVDKVDSILRGGRWCHHAVSDQFWILAKKKKYLIKFDVKFSGVSNSHIWSDLRFYEMFDMSNGQLPAVAIVVNNRKISKQLQFHPVIKMVLLVNEIASCKW